MSINTERRKQTWKQIGGKCDKSATAREIILIICFSALFACAEQLSTSEALDARREKAQKLSAVMKGD